MANEPVYRPELSGWLTRRAKNLLLGVHWKRGFWVLSLENQSLEEYKAESREQLTFEIDSKCDLLRVQKLGKDRIVVTLVNGKEVHLRADDENARNKWNDALDELVFEAGAGVEFKRSESDKFKTRSLAKRMSQTFGLTKKSQPVLITPQRPVDDPDAMTTPGGHKSLSKGVSPITGHKSVGVDALNDTNAFMAKAKNFALSTGKNFAASVKLKGNQPMQDSKVRKAVIPSQAKAERIDLNRFKKTKAQRDNLLRIIEGEFSEIAGGTLVRDLDTEAIVDLMYSMKLPKDTNIQTQGEATDRMYIIEKGRVGVYTQDFADRPPQLEIEKGENEFLGALSLLYNQPAPFTIKTHTECEFWTLPSRKFQELTALEAKKRIGRKIRLLEKVPLIAENIDPSLIAQLAESMEYKEFLAGEVVLRSGDDLTRIYIVAEGEGALLDFDGEDLGKLEKGDVFGEWALIDAKAKADANVIADTDLTVLDVEISEVEELVGPIRKVLFERWVETKSAFASQMATEDSHSEDDKPAFNHSPGPSPVNSEVPRDRRFFSAGGSGGSLKITSDRSMWQESSDTTPRNGTLFQSRSDRSMFKPSERQTRAKTSILLSLTEEQEEEAIAAIKTEVKRRETMMRVTRAQSHQEYDNQGRGTRSMPTHATSAPRGIQGIREEDEYDEQKRGSNVDQGKKSKIGPIAEDKPVEPSPVREEEDAGDGNLDLSFTRCAPLRPDLIMSSIELCALLGRGSFGRVHLARSRKNREETYALKVMTRHFIVTNGWERLVENERDAMNELAAIVNSPFLLKLWNSFTDSKNIYLLLEVCEGGDLYKLMKTIPTGCLPEDFARFYIGCVTFGLEAMQCVDIVYRDLKPENVMVTRNGYVKLADFGLAKKTLRTFTVCGTPEYMAPEVLLSRGHNGCVDWWALGVMIYELITGETPFCAAESMQVYEAILAHDKEDDIKFGETDQVTYSAALKDIICKLMHPQKNHRLGVKYPGVEAVKTHSFFSGFDWDALGRLELAPPVQPNVDTLMELSQKDAFKYDAKLFAAPDDHSGWTLSF